MQKTFSVIISILLCLQISIINPVKATAQSPIPALADHFGFVPGSDYMLFNYEQLIDYLQKLDKASPMLKLVENGHSSMGRKMYIAFISSAKRI